MVWLLLCSLFTSRQWPCWVELLLWRSWLSCFVSRCQYSPFSVSVQILIKSSIFSVQKSPLWSCSMRKSVFFQSQVRPIRSVPPPFNWDVIYSSSPWLLFIFHRFLCPFMYSSSPSNRVTWTYFFFCLKILFTFLSSQITFAGILSCKAFPCQYFYIFCLYLVFSGPYSTFPTALNHALT